VAAVVIFPSKMGAVAGSVVGFRASRGTRARRMGARRRASVGSSRASAVEDLFVPVGSLSRVDCLQ